MTAPAATSPTRERLPALDVLRGVAVAGILLANVLVFFGVFMIPYGGRSNHGSTGRLAVRLRGRPAAWPSGPVLA